MKLSINRWRRAFLRRLLGDTVTASIYGRQLASRLHDGVAPGLRGNTTLDAAKGLVSSGDVMVDVGALGGDWSYELGRRVGDQGLVIAIEADAFFAAVLKGAFNRLHMPQVAVVQTALGTKTGQAWLATKSEDGQELLGFAHIETTPSPNTTSVPMTTLDALTKVHPRLLQACLVKIDTEGYEPFILQGAVEFLKQVRPIVICEVNSEWLNRFGWTPSELYELLSAQGYKPVAANGYDIDITELAKRFKNDAVFSDDITFLHQSS